MWTYRQSTGEIIRQDGTVLSHGYAGKGQGKNNPMLENVHNVGPLPKGQYTIEKPIDTKTHGPYVMWLAPHKDNHMLGRSGFGIHADSIVHPGEASEGCIILSSQARHSIWDSGDHELSVVA